MGCSRILLKKSFATGVIGIDSAKGRCVGSDGVVYVMAKGYGNGHQRHSIGLAAREGIYVF